MSNTNRRNFIKSIATGFGKVTRFTVASVLSPIKSLLILLFCYTFLISCSNPTLDDNLPQNSTDACIVEIDYDLELGKIKQIWNGINQGYLTHFLKEKVPDVEKINSDGFEWMRFQEIFHIIYTEDDNEGNPVYDWNLWDRFIDKAVNAGFKLLLVTESTPDILATQESTYAWCNRYPPADYDKWYRFIYDVVSHCQERYGKETVESWYWEVWNEPNASSYFYGTQDDYIKIYDYTVSAIKDVNPNLKVGGAAETLSAAGSWIAALVEHCVNGVNSCTNEQGTPFDFLSFHTYPGSNKPPVLSGMEYIMDQVNAIKMEYDITDVPVIISEWNCTSASTAMRDYSYNAAFAVKASRIMLDHQVSQSFFHSLCDYVFYEGDGFSGRGGLFTASGIPKAVYHSLTLLLKLYENRLEFKPGDDNIDGIATKSDNKVNIIIANYEEDPSASYTTFVDLIVKNIPDQYDKVNYKKYIIDVNNADPYTKWASWGSPEELSEQQINILKQNSTLEVSKEATITLANHTWHEEIAMLSHSVMFFEAEFIRSN